MATSTYVADDIMLLILSFLPAKSLLRFKAVCRSWRAMISNPRFLRMHLDQSKKRLSQNLFLQMVKDDGPHPFSSVRVGDGGFQVEADLGSPGDGRIDWAVVECTCDGVTLLNDWDRRYMLWNPFTKKKTWFPMHPCEFYTTLSFGICYDPITMDDFKVVVISIDYYAVYSCKSGSWSDKKIFPYSIVKITLVPGVFVDGVIYWAVRNYEGFREIVWFDRSNDDFKTLTRPEHLEAGSVEFELACLRGCLCLFYETGGGDQIRIWVKENETTPACCWKELMIVENLHCLRPMYHFKPLCILENNNNIVIQLSSGSRCVVYSPYEKTFQEFELTRRWGWAPCVQSLLFPSTIAGSRRRRRLQLVVGRN